MTEPREVMLQIYSRLSSALLRHFTVFMSSLSSQNQNRHSVVSTHPYTNYLISQVNVGQELLPSLLHTARCYKIKGLDNVQTPPGLLEHNVSSQTGERWAEGFWYCHCGTGFVSS